MMINCKECGQELVDRKPGQYLCKDCKEKHRKEGLKRCTENRKQRWLQVEQKCRNCQQTFYAERQRSLCPNCWTNCRTKKGKSKAHMEFEEADSHYIPKKKRRYPKGSLDWYAQQIEIINTKRKKQGLPLIDYGKYTAWEEGRIRIEGLKR